jgi:uncharacterized membrane protein
MMAMTSEKPGVLRHISRTFLAGLLAALPLTLTLAVIVWLVEFIHRFMGPGSALGRMLRSIGLKFSTSELVAYLIGIVMTLTLIYFLGVLVEAGMKHRWSTLVDSTMDRVPLVRSIYSALKRLMQMFEARDPSELKAMKPVMCHFGGKGGTAVLALMPSPERIRLGEQDYYGVLIPTAPVPFGGAILYVPVDWVEPLDVAFDEMFNIYMSMGATSSDYLQGGPVAPAGSPDRSSGPKP